MRISTGMIFDAGVAGINRQTGSLLHLQQQVSSGRRILTPSDDPVAAAQALEVTQAGKTSFEESDFEVPPGIQVMDLGAMMGGRGRGGPTENLAGGGG